MKVAQLTAALIAAAVMAPAFADGAAPPESTAATPESTAVEMMNPATMAEPAKEPQAAARTIIMLMDPATLMAHDDPRHEPRHLHPDGSGCDESRHRAELCPVHESQPVRQVDGRVHEPQLLHRHGSAPHEPQHLHEVGNGTHGSPDDGRRHADDEPRHVCELDDGTHESRQHEPDDGSHEPQHVYQLGKHGG